MHITTLTSPFILRKYMMENEQLQELCGGNMFPINADDGTEGNFITTTRTDYSEDSSNNIETTTVEVELCSKDYDTAVLLMLDELRKVCITMRNAGLDVRITDCNEYKYSFKEGGETWNAECATITLTNIIVEVETE